MADTAIRNGATVLTGSGAPVYGLGLPASLDLTSAADIHTAQMQLAGAIGVVENAYQNLKNAATPAAVLALRKAQSSVSAPAYITAEIANYQSALTRRLVVFGWDRARRAVLGREAAARARPGSRPSA